MALVEDRISNALDAALEMTFPASDPIAVYTPEPLRMRSSLEAQSVDSDAKRLRKPQVMLTTSNEVASNR